MKISLSVFVFLLFFSAGYGQLKTLAEGPVFEEPESGTAKIVQMKSGNTLFLLIKGKEISVQTYNSAHQKKGEQTIPLSFSKNDFYVKGIFEINNDLVLFVKEIKDLTPMLHRMIINGTTGVLKSQEKILELDRVSRGQAFGMAFGGVPTPTFYVQKDPDSDNYAIVLMNSFVPDRNKRIEIIHYGADHKEIARAFYTSPEEKYKYLSYMDMVVIGKERVSVLAYGHNSKSSGDNDKELILANLVPGEKNVTVSRLSFSKNMIIADAITRYNPVTKRIVLLTAWKETKKSDGYIPYLAYINPVDREVEFSSPIFPVKANEKNLELFGRKHPYTGMPQNLYINRDGGFSVVYEEMSTSSTTHTMNTLLENIAVSKFDATGKEIGSCLIPKSHLLASYTVPPFYLSAREGNMQELWRGIQYKSFAYLDGMEKTYILFNDVEENTKSVKKGKITTIQSVGDCDGFYYDISGDDVLPERDFVFGVPGKRENNLALFAISDYDKKNNIYVTLKLEKERRDKGVKLVWLQPQ